MVRPPATGLATGPSLARVTAAVAAVLAAGTGGYLALGFAPLDALYQTVTTVTTVGFREVEPLDGRGQLFTIALILVGVGTVLYAFGVVLAVVLEGALQQMVGRKRMERQIDGLHDHVIVCGWGRVGKAVAHHLRGATVVVIDVDPDRLAEAEVLHVVGDATEDDVLARAGIHRARAVVAALTTDAENVFVTLTARAMRPELFIVARARDSSSGGKLLRAGADRVLNPQDLGGARMAAFVEQPHVAEFVDVVMHDQRLEFRLEEVVVPTGSPLVGQTLRHAAIRERTGALVLAVREVGGQFVTNPAPEHPLRSGQVLIAIGTPEELAELVALTGSGVP